MEEIKSRAVVILKNAENLKTADRPWTSFLEKDATEKGWMKVF